MMDDNTDGLIGLFVVGAIILVFVCGGFIIWGIVTLMNEAAEHPDDVKQAAKWLGLIVSAPIWLPAWLVLFLMRDLVVRDWQYTRSERNMIILWVAGVPLVEAAIFMGLVLMIHPVNVGLALLYFVAILAGHFYLYFMRPPQHANWPIFLAAEEQMLFDMRSALALGRYNLRLWCFAQRQAVRNLLKRGEKTGG